MAPVSSVSSSSSLYGNRNVISGLASGMDTEAMIENMVSGTKARITALQQKRTIWEWKQEAFRGIIDKMVAFSNKYTSYNSNTNLLSPSFFNNAVTTTTHGAFKDMVSATGKTSSDIAITSVKQLATAAKHTATMGGSGDVPTIEGGKPIDLAQDMKISTVSGSLTFTYGTKTVDIDLGEVGEDVFADPKAFAEAINKKLSEQTITTSSGETVKANTLIKVSESGGKISFSDAKDAGNSVYISGAVGKVKETLGLDNPSKDKPSELDLSDVDLSKEVPTAEYLSEKEISVTLDGITKKIKLPKYEKPADGADSTLTDEEKKVKKSKAFLEDLQTSLTKAFGTNSEGEPKILVDQNGVAETGEFKLKLSTAKGSTMSVNSKINDALGLGENGATSYLNTGKSLGDLKLLDGMGGGYELMGEGEPIKQKDDTYRDKNGNRVNADGVRLDEDGEKMIGYDMTINGVKIGTYTKDSKLETLIADINNNTEAGVNVTYSKTTNQFLFTATETGEANGIEIKSALSTTADENGKFLETNLAAHLFAAKDADGKTIDVDERGQDAIFSMKVNGSDAYKEISRSTNTFDVDGLSITLKGEFGYKEVEKIENGQPVLDGSGNPVKERVIDNTAEEVTFTTAADADKIVEAVKSMIEDYNDMMSEIKKAYSTLPAQKKNGVKYSPLTDADKEGMSESAIKAYEDKVKQGLLFGDSDLSSLHSKLRFTFSGADATFLKSIGITSEYSMSDNTSSIKLDENKLRDALANNPDAVKDVFTKSVASGAPANGIMTTIKTQLDNYAGYLGENKGILVNKAGTSYSSRSMLNNSIQKSMDSIDKQIERWETKLSDQVDRYTSKFSQLEVLIQQMNAQSSSLAGLMMGQSS